MKKVEFDSLQNELALFKDSNLNIIDSRFQNSLQKLESEFNIVSSVYQELSKQVEQSKLQVSKDTPIFSVIKPATVPNVRDIAQKSSNDNYFCAYWINFGIFDCVIKNTQFYHYTEKLRPEKKAKKRFFFGYLLGYFINFIPFIVRIRSFFN